MSQAARQPQHQHAADDAQGDGRQPPQNHPRRLNRGEIEYRRQRLKELVIRLDAIVLPEIIDMLRHWQASLVLADSDGVILTRWGNQRLMAKNPRDWLEIGVQWRQDTAGNNVIGDCLTKGQSVELIGREHACGALQHLSGYAIPLAHPGGEIDGCLALFSDTYHDRAERYQGLLQVLAIQIENQRLDQYYRQQYFRLTFNANQDDMDSPRSGLLILDANGHVMTTNARARWLLGMDGERLSGLPIEALCDRRWPSMVAGADELIALHFDNRYHCYCRLDRPEYLPDDDGNQPSALAALDLGDPRLHQTIVLARRLGDRGIAMLLYGETGTGKEVFVKALHMDSERAGQPLITINCAAIPDALVEAELFGYVRGAFTGADPRGNPGRLREAHGGRLFLDEIGDMPLPVQARLLRVLQERQVTPLGGSTAYPVNIELIAATHRPLAEEVANGRFRADLYYRLCGVELKLPPLRERCDTRALILVLLERLSRDSKHPYEGAVSPRPSPALLDWLCSQQWPGNIRELENILRVTLAMSDGSTLDMQHLPGEPCLATDPATPVHPPPSLAAQYRSPQQASASLQEHLEAHRGNLSALARELGISRTTLYKRLREQHWPLSAG